MDIGEALECQPDKIRDMCKIFNGLNDEEIECWEGYDDSLQKQNEAFTDGPTSTQKSFAKLMPNELGRTKQRKKNRKVKDNVACTLVRDSSSLSIEEARKLLQPHIKPQQTNPPHESNARSKKKKTRKAKKKKQSKDVSVTQAGIDADESDNIGLDILSLCGT